MRTRLLLVVTVSIGVTLVPLACGGKGHNSGSPTDAATGDDADAGDDASDDADAEAAPIDAGPDVDHGKPSSQYPAPHPPLPTLETNGGVTLSTPKVWLIFFNYQNNPYPYEAQIQSFAQGVAASKTYWSSMGAEYGVGPFTYAGSTEITDEAPPASIDSQQIDQWMQQKVGAGTFGGAPDPNTIYTIVYPSSTTITLQNGQSCQSFGGYHADTTAGGVGFPYAVLPTCSNFDGLTGVDAVTGPMSHEWIEASTDPFPMTAPAYNGVDQLHLAWELFGGAEDGDLCIPEPNAFVRSSDVVAPDGGPGFVVQRCWSNALAKASHDPCAPNLAESYFNSAPVLNDNVSVNFGGGSVLTKGVKIPVGQSKTIEVDLFSDGPAGPWSVQAQDALAMQLGTTMTFSWDKKTGQNGEKLYLTITVKRKSQFGAGVFLIVSSLGLRSTSWPGIVGEQ